MSADPFDLGGSDVEDEEEVLLASGLKHTLYVVDVRKNMTATMSDSEDTYLQRACSGIAASLRSLLVKGTKEKAGVILCGVNKSDDEYGTKVLLPLQVPSVSDVSVIEKIASGKTDVFKEYGGFPEYDPLPLDNAMTSVLSSIRNYASDKDMVDVILFSNDLNPCKDETALKDRVLKRVTSDFRSARHAAVSVYLCNFGIELPPGNFWRQVLLTETESGALVFDPDAVFPIDFLSESLKRKAFQKRAYARIPFMLGEDVQFAVGVYHTIKPAMKPTPKKVEASTNEVVKSEMHWVCQETGEELGPHQIRTQVNYGGKFVPITKEEVQEIKSLAPRGFQLLGFKPKSAIPLENLKPSLFIYPEEGVIQGSTTAFAALHAKMLELDRIAIVRGVLRTKGDQPKLFAFVPVRASHREDEGYQPEGMFAIQLPYADNLRPSEPAPSRELPANSIVEAAAGVRKLLTIQNFEQNRVANPVLQKMYSFIEALALERESPEWNEEEDDMLQPAFQTYSNWPEIEEALTAFQNSINDLDEEGEVEELPAPRRKKAPGKATPTRKRQVKSTAPGKRQRVKRETR